ncbi:MAG: hypothetical protein ABW000_07200 [Actinoplanes sp.]
MSEDKNDENTARADAARARRAAYENGEFTVGDDMADVPFEQRSRWDTSLNTSTTPRRVIDNWDQPAPQAQAPAEDSKPDGETTSTPTTEPEK